LDGWPTQYTYIELLCQATSVLRIVPSVFWCDMSSYSPVIISPKYFVWLSCRYFTFLWRH